MAGKSNTTSAPRGARQRPLTTDWRAALTTEERKAVDEIVSRYGDPMFERLACTRLAARRKRGAPSKVPERAQLLEKMANLLIANPTWRPWRAATQVAREHHGPMVSLDGLRQWLLRAFEKDGDQLLARARAAEAQLSDTMNAPHEGTPAAVRELLREMRMPDLDATEKRFEDQMARYAAPVPARLCPDISSARAGLELAYARLSQRPMGYEPGIGAAGWRAIQDRMDADARIRRMLLEPGCMPHLRLENNLRFR